MGVTGLTGSSFGFARPPELGASGPPESRGLSRDGVRLLVSIGTQLEHRQFRELPELLRPGDVLVVNRSGTLAASLPARADIGDFRLNLSTWYGRGQWLAEPRWDHATPGPLPLLPGAQFEVASLPARVLAPFPGLPRLEFLEISGDVAGAMAREGEPIRYGYLRGRYPLESYQTIFADTPGSAEMPSAGRPFTLSMIERLRHRGVEIVPILLHAGVSSLEADPQRGVVPVFPEPFEVPWATARAVNEARRSGRRVIAVGTTVVRALESATDEGRVRAARGFTRTYVSSQRGIRTVDGLLTGFHDPRTTHLDMLEAVAGRSVVERSYAAALSEGYLWHEFGDSHLILHG